MKYELREQDIQRFESKTVRGDGCWTWTGAHYKNSGYAMFAMRDLDGKWRPTVGHRVAYQIHRGPIPDGLQLDHLCRNRGCVNPDHLEAVEQRVNIARGVGQSVLNAAKTHCPKGHEFTPENTYVRPTGKHRSRECRTCMAARPRYDRYIERDRAAFYAEGRTCPHGHLYDEANTYWRKNTGSPLCRACAAAAYHRKKN